MRGTPRGDKVYQTLGEINPNDQTSKLYELLLKNQTIKGKTYIFDNKMPIYFQFSKCTFSKPNDFEALASEDEKKVVLVQSYDG